MPSLVLLARAARGRRVGCDRGPLPNFRRPRPPPLTPAAHPAREVDERAPGRFQHATFHNAERARRGTREPLDEYDVVPGSRARIVYSIGYCALSGRRYMVLTIRKERRHRTRRLYARLNSLYCRLPGFDEPGFDVRAASARVTHTAPPQCIPPSNADAALDSSSI